jgi:CheY-like chemotaxis protein
MCKMLSGRRVLVVEDEMLLLMTIEDMLADQGCESVTAAATVDQALALVNAQVFDVAMLDLNLNGNQTYAVADALVARGVPFFFSTGYSAHAIRESFHDRPVLRKPYKHEEIVEMLGRLLSTDVQLPHEHINPDLGAMQKRAN